MRRGVPASAPGALGGPIHARSEASFTGAVLTPLRALFQKCDNGFFKAIDLIGVGRTEKEARKDLEDNENAVDKLAERARTCLDKMCPDGAGCEYDSATVGEPKCQKKTVSSRHGDRTEEVWVCRRTMLIGCFCAEKE